MKTNKIKIRLVSSVLYLLLLIPHTTFAESLINLGTLDVKLLSGKESINLDLSSNQQFQEKLQISNFSSETKELEIYKADAEKINSKEFIANSKNQLSQDIYPWISLPTNHLTLKAGESKILSVNIKTPNNAGVGMHTGAIMISEKFQGQDQNEIKIEKGIRIYANIKGTASPKMQFSNNNINQTDRFITYNAILSNSGNTDLKGDINFNLLNQNNQKIDSQTTQIFLKPGQTKAIDLAINKPIFGFYKTTLTNNLLKSFQTTELSSNIFIPSQATNAAMVLILGLVTIWIFKKAKKTELNINTLINLIRTNKLILQKSSAFLGTLVFTAFAFNSFSPIYKKFTRADLLNPVAKDGYITTVKWGNMHNLHLPSTYKNNWKGSLLVKNGTITIKNLLNIEPNDKIELNQDNTVLNFQNTTGPDNDGVELLITPTTSDQIPTITYRNANFPNNLDINLAKNIRNKIILPYHLHAIQITSNLAPETSSNIFLPTAAELSAQIAAEETIVVEPAIETPAIDIAEVTTPIEIIETNAEIPLIPAIEDLLTTSDINLIFLTPDSTPEITTPETTIDPDLSQPLDTLTTTDTTTQPSIIEPITIETRILKSPVNPKELTEELETLETIIKDLPTSPEILSEYIINSDYVQKVTAENNITQIETNPILIEVLKNSPNILKEIAGTPDLNFIFLPNQKIKMTPQQFSFDQKHLTTQELGKIIFVQNRATAWNTYVTVSDFVSVSGKSNIPASAITITPGEIQNISTIGANSIIQSGQEVRLDNSNSQANLVNIEPQNDTQEIFIMKPKITVEIPKGTAPGLYRAQITIKTL